MSAPQAAGDSTVGTVFEEDIAEVTRAYAEAIVNAAEKQSEVEGVLGATPVVRLVVDPSLIGGLVVQVGDHVYDASVRNRLEQLRQRLIEGKTHEIQSRRDHFSYPA